MAISLGDAILTLMADDGPLNATLNRGEQAAKGWGDRVSGFFANAASVALGGLVEKGITAVVGGFTQAAGAGFSFNNSMEQSSAKINAFTKDADLTAKILQDIQKEAANTPFEFDQMADSVAGLLPAAKQADVGIMELLKDAEILAASNPAEGLDGATFALREAVSGDFTSVIERFNLPRQMINQLKEEGVPNLEIVRRAMAEMGYDMDLVSALANTAEGRWSTLKDTFTNLAGMVTKPIFDALSRGLGVVNDMLTANAPLLNAFAEMLAGQLQVAIDYILTTGIPALMSLSGWFTGEGSPALQQFIEPLTGWLLPALQELGGRILNEVIPAIVAFITPIIEQVVPGLQLLGEILFNLAMVYLATLIQWWNFLIDNINIVIPILTALGVVILALTSPISLVIGAIVLLATAWANNWGGIQEKTQAVLDFIMPYIDQAMTFIQGVIVSVLTYLAVFWQQHGDSIMTIINFVWTTIVAVVDKNIKTVQFIIETVAAIITAFWQEWGDELLLLASTAWENIKVFIQTTMDLIGFIIDAAAALIKGDWEAFGEALRNIWQTTWDAIKTIISNLGNTLAAIITDNIINPINQKWEAFSEGLSETWSSLWDGMVEIVQDSLNPFEEAISQLMDWINDAIDGLLEMIGLQEEAGEGDSGPAPLSGGGGGFSGVSGPAALGGAPGNTRNITFIQNVYGGTPNAASDLQFLNTLPVT